MTLLFVFLWLLFVHFIGDFVLQSNWMAQNKSKDWSALTRHVMVYTVTLMAGVVIAMPWMDVLTSKYQRLAAVVSVGFIIVNGALHFATDAVTSRINSKLWTEKRVHGFFVGVGADQFIHAATICLTLAWIMKP